MSKKIRIEKLFTYPIKSTQNINLKEVAVKHTGFEFDRKLAIINAKKKVITGRENQKLLSIKTKIVGDKLIILKNNIISFVVDLQKENATEEIDIQLFKKITSALEYSHPVNKWLSLLLDEPCTLVAVLNDTSRKMEAKYNASTGDYITLSDAAPVHLISLASLQYLNNQLSEKVSIHNFRPNIVISGNQPFEEDKWSDIDIGNCKFEVAIKTARCPFITIHPKTGVFYTNQEPLRTLAKERKINGAVNFGIYLIPRKTGVISLKDSVTVN